jgi:hypothetical protein
LLSPKVVGFTVFNTNFISCLLVAGRLKMGNPATIIAFGGPTASQQAKFIIETYPYVDFCVRNEGEEACFELFSQLAASSFRVDPVLMRDARADTNIRTRPSHEALAGFPAAESDDDLDRMVCFDATSRDVYSLAALLDGSAGLFARSPVVVWMNRRLSRQMGTRLWWFSPPAPSLGRGPSPIPFL